MKKFILSDLHIGLEDANYDIMNQAINYIRQKAEAGDQILGLGDWFHITGKGLDFCMRHPMTLKFRDLAEHIPTKLIPGNHDHQLGRYQDNPGLDNPISPITIVKPFVEDGIWYCHGHEYDPICRYVGWIPDRWTRLMHKRTMGSLKADPITRRYLLWVYLVYLRASLNLQKKARTEGQKYNGIVMGHTHLPFQPQSPELPVLIDAGDMRHNSTFVVRDEEGFQLMRWNSAQKQWLVTSSLRL